MATITLFYVLPTDKSEWKFDESYYINEHMPLVGKTWGPHGLNGYQISKVKEEDSPYHYQALLFWESIEAWKKASKEHGAACYEDIPNYTNLKLVFYATEVTDAWQK